MSGWTKHTGKIAVLDADNIDTDRIIPARFLSMITRSGYGDLLFNDVRSADFALDRPEAKGASILVVGVNFGCGSSREHAVWSLQQAGFEAVIAKKTETAPGFSDIFRQNASNCGMLLIELNEPDHASLSANGQGASITIDLESQKVVHGSNCATFEIGESAKQAMIKGHDLIGLTLEFSNAISSYEQNSMAYVPSKK